MVDQKTQESLVLQNQGLVYAEAKRWSTWGVDFLDLVQSGNIGLVEAAKRYDPNRPTKFSTMATWWIKKYIKEAVCNNNTVHVPPVQYWRELRRGNRFYYTEYKESGSDSNAVVSALVSRLMGILSTSERDVIERVYLEDRPISEVALRRGVSKQRVSAICRRALSKMRHAARD